MAVIVRNDDKGETDLLREYELTIIINSQLSEENAKKLLDKYESIFLEAEGSEIILKNDWGVKKLAYPIQKQFRGRYVFYDFIGLPANLAEAERLMRIDDQLLRYMSVHIGENVNVDQRKAELAKKEAAAAQKTESAF